jgi:hypothetical protein
MTATNQKGGLTETDRPTETPTPARERVPYVALYSRAVRNLMACRDRVAKDVLESLAMCANPIGLCYPGIGYIADEIGAADSTVANALHRLEKMAYIRVYKTVNVLRGRSSIDYQISPYVLFISDGYIEQALALWHTNIDNSESKESQPTPKNLTTESKYREPTTHNQHHQQTAPRNGEAWGASVAYYAKRGAQSYRTPPAPQGAKPTAAQAATFPPPSSAPPPSVPRLVSYDAPLPDEAAELLAARMNVDTGYRLSVANARGLVVRYGAARCEAALAHVENQTDVKSPAALLRWYIEGGHVDPMQDGKTAAHDWPTDKNKWLTGEFAQFFNQPPIESEDENGHED